MIDKRRFFARTPVSMVVDESILTLSDTQIRGVFSDVVRQGASLMGQYNVTDASIIISKDLLLAARRESEQKMRMIAGLIQPIRTKFPDQCFVKEVSEIRRNPYNLLSVDISASPMYAHASRTYLMQKGNRFWNIYLPEMSDIEIEIDPDDMQGCKLRAEIGELNLAVDMVNSTCTIRQVPTANVMNLKLSVVMPDDSVTSVEVQDVSRLADFIEFSIIKRVDDYLMIPRIPLHQGRPTQKGAVIGVNEAILEELKQGRHPVCQGDNNQYQLDTEINAGGEGKIISIHGDDSILGKLYTKPIHHRLKSKLEHLAKFSHPQISFPEAVLLYNQQFAGYVMPKLNGVDIDTFLNLNNLKNNYPNYTRLDLVEIALNWLQLMKHLHASGIYVVDINPQNILVDPDSKLVSIVDIDSAQVDSYPCEVGVEDYLSPRQIDHLHNGQLDMSTYKDELFSIAIMLFKILMGNRDPLVCKGMADGMPKNKQRNFVYTYKTYGNATLMPGGSWPVLWERMSDGMKQFFHDVFTEDKEINLTKIIHITDEYRKYIKKKKKKKPALNSLQKKV